jgi:hypothetical protein
MQVYEIFTELIKILFADCLNPYLLVFSWYPTVSIPFCIFIIIQYSIPVNSTYPTVEINELPKPDVFSVAPHENISTPTHVKWSSACNSIVSYLSLSLSLSLFLSLSLSLCVCVQHNFYDLEKVGVYLLCLIKPGTSNLYIFYFVTYTDYMNIMVKRCDKMYIFCSFVWLGFFN